MAAPGTVSWTIDAQPLGSNVIFSPSANALNPLITVNKPGEYQIKITDNVCNHATAVTIQFLDDPHPNIKDTSLCLNNILALLASGGGLGSSYLWSNGSVDSITQITESGTYYVAVTNLCATITDSAAVVFFSCDLNVPNVLTPNGNDLNELFYLKNLEFYPNTALIIFNRWGAKLFETDNYQNDWKGSKYNDGVYYYILSGPKLIEPQTGFFQIIR